MTDWQALGLVGLLGTAVLVATASGLFADPPIEVAPARQPPAAQRPLRLVDAPKTALEPPAVVAAAVPVAARVAPPTAPEQGEWRFPALPEVKAALPQAANDSQQRPAAVLAPGEQQAAWAARDQLANAARANGAVATSPVLTRLHEGPPPDKAAAGR